LKYGGALSGEHGDGLVRGWFMEKMFGPALYQAFRTVKHTFDAGGVFNPGKIVDCPPLTSNLRYGADYKTPDPPTYFDYSEYGGFGRAGRDVQRCRRVPQEAGRDDVPVVYGDEGREGCHARPREHAAAGDDRSSRGSRSRR
jgi:hypothetical protein